MRQRCATSTSHSTVLLVSMVLFSRGLDIVTDISKLTLNYLSMIGFGRESEQRLKFTRAEIKGF